MYDALTLLNELALEGVTTGLAKRDPTNRKSVHERLRNIWQVGFREGRNVGGPTRSAWAVTTCPAKRDPTNRKSVRERLKKISLVGF